MKLLFVTNFYPPASRGGYEQWCEETLNSFRLRGHEVVALTSVFGKERLPNSDPNWVHRDLHLEMELASLKNAVQFFTHRKKREIQNLNRVRALIENFKPDVVLIWGMWNLHRSIPALIEELMPGRVAYYMGDYWPTLPSQFENYWNARSRNLFTLLPKLILRRSAQKILKREKRPDLRLENVMFASQYMRDEFKRKGISPRNPSVVYGAIDTKPYLNGNRDAVTQKGISLLWIGRLAPEKGIHTAIEAVGNLVRNYGIRDLSLTIVGDGEREYAEELHRLVERNNLASFVTFLPAQPKERVPAFYLHSDIFLFTSIWAEPFGRVIVEAMASGLAVVGTAVGGAAEILVQEENALIFAANDAPSLSLQIRRLIEEPELRRKLGAAGREDAKNRFDLKRMVQEIESYVGAMLAQANA